MKHGTISGYKYHGCRCNLCRARNSEVETKRQKTNRSRLLKSLERK